MGFSQTKSLVGNISTQKMFKSLVLGSALSAAAMANVVYQDAEAKQNIGGSANLGFGDFGSVSGSANIGIPENTGLLSDSKSAVYALGSMVLLNFLTTLALPFFTSAKPANPAEPAEPAEPATPAGDEPEEAEKAKPAPVKISPEILAAIQAAIQAHQPVAAPAPVATPAATPVDKPEVDGIRKRRFMSPK